MASFWIEFSDRPAGCVETDPYLERGEHRDVLAIAAEFGTVKAVHLLPYPREPRLGKKSECPSFCYGNVRDCLGKTSCPRSYACSE